MTTSRSIRLIIMRFGRSAAALASELHAGTAVEGAAREALAAGAVRDAASGGGGAADAHAAEARAYRLRTAYRDGTTRAVFEPLGFLARLGRASAAAARGPDEIPRGVRPACSAALGDHAGGARAVPGAQVPTSNGPHRNAWGWMQRLKRVFAIEIERCRGCGGLLEVIASIEDLALIAAEQNTVYPVLSASVWNDGVEFGL